MGRKEGRRTLESSRRRHDAEQNSNEAAGSRHFAAARIAIAVRFLFYSDNFNELFASRVC